MTTNKNKTATHPTLTISTPSFGLKDIISVPDSMALDGENNEMENEIEAKRLEKIGRISIQAASAMNAAKLTSKEDLARQLLDLGLAKENVDSLMRDFYSRLKNNDVKDQVIKRLASIGTEALMESVKLRNVTTAGSNINKSIKETKDLMETGKVQNKDLLTGSKLTNNVVQPNSGTGYETGNTNQNQLTTVDIDTKMSQSNSSTRNESGTNQKQPISVNIDTEDTDESNSSTYPENNNTQQSGTTEDLRLTALQNQFNEIKEMLNTTINGTDKDLLKQVQSVNKNITIKNYIKQNNKANNESGKDTNNNNNNKTNKTNHNKKETNSWIAVNFQLQTTQSPPLNPYNTKDKPTTKQKTSYQLKSKKTPTKTLNMRQAPKFPITKSSTTVAETSQPKFPILTTASATTRWSDPIAANTAVIDRKISLKTTPSVLTNTKHTTRSNSKIHLKSNIALDRKVPLQSKSNLKNQKNNTRPHLKIRHEPSTTTTLAESYLDQLKTARQRAHSNIQYKKVSLCQHGRLLDGMVLKGGPKAGKLLGRRYVFRPASCIKHCCSTPGCNVAMVVHRMCHVMRCVDRMACEAVQKTGIANHHAYSLAFIYRGLKDIEDTAFLLDMIKRHPTNFKQYPILPSTSTATSMRSTPISPTIQIHHPITKPHQQQNSMEYQTKRKPTTLPSPVLGSKTSPDDADSLASKHISTSGQIQTTAEELFLSPTPYTTSTATPAPNLVDSTEDYLETIYDDVNHVFIRQKVDKKKKIKTRKNNRNILGERFSFDENVYKGKKHKQENIDNNKILRSKGSISPKLMIGDDSEEGTEDDYIFNGEEKDTNHAQDKKSSNLKVDSTTDLSDDYIFNKEDGNRAQGEKKTKLNENELTDLNDDYIFNDEIKTKHQIHDQTTKASQQKDQKTTDLGELSSVAEQLLNAVNKSELVRKYNKGLLTEPESKELFTRAKQVKDLINLIHDLYEGSMKEDHNGPSTPTSPKDTTVITAGNEMEKLVDQDTDDDEQNVNPEFDTSSKEVANYDNDDSNYEEKDNSDIIGSYTPTGRVIRIKPSLTHYSDHDSTYYSKHSKEPTGGYSEDRKLERVKELQRQLDDHRNKLRKLLSPDEVTNATNAKTEAIKRKTNKLKSLESLLKHHKSKLKKILTEDGKIERETLPHIRNNNNQIVSNKKLKSKPHDWKVKHMQSVLKHHQDRLNKMLDRIKQVDGGSQAMDDEDDISEDPTLIENSGNNNDNDDDDGDDGVENRDIMKDNSKKMREAREELHQIKTAEKFLGTLLNAQKGLHTKDKLNTKDDNGHSQVLTKEGIELAGKQDLQSHKRLTTNIELQNVPYHKQSQSHHDQVQSIKQSLPEIGELGSSRNPTTSQRNINNAETPSGDQDNQAYSPIKPDQKNSDEATAFSSVRETQPREYKNPSPEKQQAMLPNILASELVNLTSVVKELKTKLHYKDHSQSYHPRPLSTSTPRKYDGKHISPTEERVIATKNYPSQPREIQLDSIDNDASFQYSPQGKPTIPEDVTRYGDLGSEANQGGDSHSLYKEGINNYQRRPTTESSLPVPNRSMNEDTKLEGNIPWNELLLQDNRDTHNDKLTKQDDQRYMEDVKDTKDKTYPKMNNENAEDDVPANHDGQGYMHDSIKDQTYASSGANEDSKLFPEDDGSKILRAVTSNLKDNAPNTIPKDNGDKENDILTKQRDQYRDGTSVDRQLGAAENNPKDSMVPEENQDNENDIVEEPYPFENVDNRLNFEYASGDGNSGINLDLSNQKKNRRNGLHQGEYLKSNTELSNGNEIAGKPPLRKKQNNDHSTGDEEKSNNNKLLPLTDSNDNIKMTDTNKDKNLTLNDEDNANGSVGPIVEHENNIATGKIKNHIDEPVKTSPGVEETDNEDVSGFSSGENAEIHSQPTLLDTILETGNDNIQENQGDTPNATRHNQSTSDTIVDDGSSGDHKSTYSNDGNKQKSEDKDEKATLAGDLQDPQKDSGALVKDLQTSSKVSNGLDQGETKQTTKQHGEKSNVNIDEIYEDTAPGLSSDYTVFQINDAHEKVPVKITHFKPEHDGSKELKPQINDQNETVPVKTLQVDEIHNLYEPKPQIDKIQDKKYDHLYSKSKELKSSQEQDIPADLKPTSRQIPPQYPRAWHEMSQHSLDGFSLEGDDQENDFMGRKSILKNKNQGIKHFEMTKPVLPTLQTRSPNNKVVNVEQVFIPEDSKKADSLNTITSLDQTFQTNTKDIQETSKPFTKSIPLDQEDTEDNDYEQSGSGEIPENIQHHLIKPVASKIPEQTEIISGQLVKPMKSGNLKQPMGVRHKTPKSVTSKPENLVVNKPTPISNTHLTRHLSPRIAKPAKVSATKKSKHSKDLNVEKNMRNLNKSDSKKEVNREANDIQTKKNKEDSFENVLVQSNKILEPFSRLNKTTPKPITKISTIEKALTNVLKTLEHLQLNNHPSSSPKNQKKNKGHQGRREALTSVMEYVENLQKITPSTKRGSGAKYDSKDSIDDLGMNLKLKNILSETKHLREVFNNDVPTILPSRVSKTVETDNSKKDLNNEIHGKDEVMLQHSIPLNEINTENKISPASRNIKDPLYKSSSKLQKTTSFHGLENLESPSYKLLKKKMPDLNPSQNPIQTKDFNIHDNEDDAMNQDEDDPESPQQDDYINIMKQVTPPTQQVQQKPSLIQGDHKFPATHHKKLHRKSQPQQQKDVTYPKTLPSVEEYQSSKQQQQQQNKQQQQQQQQKQQQQPNGPTRSKAADNEDRAEIHRLHGLINDIGFTSSGGKSGFGYPTKFYDVSHEKRRLSVTDNCRREAYTMNHRFKGGLSAGVFTTMLSVNNVDDCVTKCCTFSNCTHALFFKGFCYTVKCTNPVKCETEALPRALDDVPIIIKIQHLGKLKNKNQYAPKDIDEEAEQNPQEVINKLKGVIKSKLNNTNHEVSVNSKNIVKPMVELVNVPRVPNKPIKDVVVKVLGDDENILITANEKVSQNESSIFQSPELYHTSSTKSNPKLPEIEEDDGENEDENIANKSENHDQRILNTLRELRMKGVIPGFITPAHRTNLNKMPTSSVTTTMKTTQRHPETTQGSSDNQNLNQIIRPTVGQGAQANNDEQLHNIAKNISSWMREHDTPIEHVLQRIKTVATQKHQQPIKTTEYTDQPIKMISQTDQPISDQDVLREMFDDPATVSQETADHENVIEDLINEPMKTVNFDNEPIKNTDSNKEMYEPMRTEKLIDKPIKSRDSDNEPIKEPYSERNKSDTNTHSNKKEETNEPIRSDFKLNQPINETNESTQPITNTDPKDKEKTTQQKTISFVIETKQKNNTDNTTILPTRQILRVEKTENAVKHLEVT